MGVLIEGTSSHHPPLTSCICTLQCLHHLGDHEALLYTGDDGDALAMDLIFNGLINEVCLQY